ncbi:MAG: hypothetical protein QOJ63_3641, partial [Solirubrobacteraceae bacterium]|nr:hypothetical protein [Solirubrobacteraceae bacterium]
FRIDVRAPGSAAPDATDAAVNLFMGDVSVESAGLLTAPIRRAATGAARREALLHVALGADPDGGLARALGGATVPLQLDVNVIGRRGEDRPAAAASATKGLGVAAAIAVIVGCLLIGLLAGSIARRLRGAS